MLYTISSDGSMTDSGSSFGEGLFGGISWPRSRFRLPEGSLVEQQMFLPDDGSAVALSWALHGDTASVVQLVVRPFFTGCGPRSYRDVGFQFDSDEDGGRLIWLPNVRGPRIVADTNGQYRDEPVQLSDCLCEQAAASASPEDLITPGRFEFELTPRPSVLIFSAEGNGSSQCDQHVGAFLAGLMQKDSPPGAGLRRIDSASIKSQQLPSHDQHSELFRLSGGGVKQICGVVPVSLRSNRIINRALRTVYRRFDRRKETRNSCESIFPDRLAQF